MELKLLSRFISFLKTSILIVSLCFGCNSFAFDYKEDDKQKHIGATAVMSAGTYIILRENKMGKFKSGLLAFLLTMAVAHVKEDYFDDTYNSEDMQANAVGSAAGVMIPLVFTF